MTRSHSQRICTIFTSLSAHQSVSYCIQLSPALLAAAVKASLVADFATVAWPTVYCCDLLNKNGFKSLIAHCRSGFHAGFPHHGKHTFAISFAVWYCLYGRHYSGQVFVLVVAQHVLVYLRQIGWTFSGTRSAKFNSCLVLSKFCL